MVGTDSSVGGPRASPLMNGFGRFVYQKLSKNEVKFGRLVRQSKKILLRISSIFPFDLFPDTLVIDENKVNLITKSFLKVENIHSIFYENITSVTVNTNIFFASIDVVDSTNLRFPETYTINFLSIPKAIKARKLIQGLIELKRSDVDLSCFNKKEVKNKLEILGHADKDF